MGEHYRRVECGCEKVLLEMELAGMGLNEREYEDTRCLLDARLRILEDRAVQLAGRQFSLSSPADINQILYKDLRLPVNGDPKLKLSSVHGGKNGIKFSSGKEILQKLGELHEFPRLVLEHRRLSSAVSKVVAPLLTVRTPHPALLTPRVYPVATTHTATGRVSLHEPNVQNIPKDFELQLTDELKSKALGRRSLVRRRRSSNNNSSLAMSPLARLLEPAEKDGTTATVSLRHSMVPSDGHLMLAADYSQLELRVMAHLSRDEELIGVLTSGGDVFRALAAALHSCQQSQVTDAQRQSSKQIVYGVLYGMGDKALAGQLGMEAMEAVRFMERFKRRYPGVGRFLVRCVADCRKSGWVETISGRRRPLPDINHSNAHRRAAAERQAVNTTVQGSAADLVKTAMAAVDA